MQLVLQHKERVTTTSVLIAQKFGKEHKNVLRDIQELKCSSEFRGLNFELSSYKSAQNRDLPMYIITRDGFTMLVMSFTGERAMKFKEEYISEFNRMEDILRQGKTPVLIPTYQMRILSEPTKSCPHDKWCVFDESHQIMLFVEKHIGSLNKYDLVDGSIGTRWAKYRAGQPWANVTFTYMHEYTDNRGSRECKCYDMRELKYFRQWLEQVYKRNHLYDYLLSKYKNEGNVVMIDKVTHTLPTLLKRIS